MNEFIEKLIGRLEEEIKDVSESQSSYEVGSDMSITCSHIMGTLRDVKNRIIPKLAEEHKSDVMINEQYCWNTCGATEHCKECNRLCNGSIDYYENYDFMAEEYNGGWIPCENELPKETGCYLVTYRKNRELLVDAWYFNGRNFNQVDEIDVIAWQPLSKPYNPKGE